MTAQITRGRPQASSRETIAEAAGELFLEEGYARTSVMDITRRAGVSRSSFFNYFDSKAATLWFELDEHIEHLCTALQQEGGSTAEAIRSFADGAVPQQLLLAIANAETMGIADALHTGRAERQLRVAGVIVNRLIRTGTPPLRAEVIGSGYAGALFAAVWRWALLGSGRHSLRSMLEDGMGAARAVLDGHDE